MPLWPENNHAPYACDAAHTHAYTCTAPHLPCTPPALPHACPAPHQRMQIEVKVSPGSHASEAAVNKQLGDKERVAAALENAHLLDVVNRCVRHTEKLEPPPSGSPTSGTGDAGGAASPTGGASAPAGHDAASIAS